MKKVIAYIDGFNMYHSIHKKLPDYFKWLDYYKLIESLLLSDEELKEVILFTAKPTWNEPQSKRHQAYMRVLSEHCGVKVILGQYKEKSVRFNLESHPIIDKNNIVLAGAKVDPTAFIFRTFEEKETDVNIAIHVLKGGFRDEYDTAYILTADSDISPVVQMCRQLFPEKKYCFVFPYKKFGRTNQQVAHAVKALSKKKLEDALLPETCIFPDGTSIASPYKKPTSEDVS